MYAHYPPGCQPRTAEVGGTRTDLDKRVEGLESKTQIKKSAFNAFHELSNLRGESIWKAGFVSNFLRGNIILLDVTMLLCCCCGLCPGPLFHMINTKQKAWPFKLSNCISVLSYDNERTPQLFSFSKLSADNKSFYS